MCKHVKENIYVITHSDIPWNKYFPTYDFAFTRTHTLNSSFLNTPHFKIKTEYSRLFWHHFVHFNWMKFSFVTPRNARLVYTNTVLYRSYMFRHHLCHPQGALRHSSPRMVSCWNPQDCYKTVFVYIKGAFVGVMKEQFNFTWLICA
jgi:hypothetical protein